MNQSRNHSPQLVLASASPRRRALLAQIGVDCSVQPVDIDEAVLPRETPRAYVERLALAKARACCERAGTDDVFLGADTAVVLDDAILGKPRDRDDAFGILRRLSGREHAVMTSVALVRGAKEAVRVNTSRVGFGDLSDAMIAAYWETGEPTDKAGAYGIQGRAGAFIHHIAGSYSGVMGLPLYETAALLREFGIISDI